MPDCASEQRAEWKAVRGGENFLSQNFFCFFLREDSVQCHDPYPPQKTPTRSLLGCFYWAKLPSQPRRSKRPIRGLGAMPGRLAVEGPGRRVRWTVHIFAGLVVLAVLLQPARAATCWNFSATAATAEDVSTGVHNAGEILIGTGAEPVVVIFLIFLCVFFFFFFFCCGFKPLVVFWSAPLLCFHSQ